MPIGHKYGIVTTYRWSSNYATQLFTEMDVSHFLYTRYYNNGTWSSWQKLATEEDLSRLREKRVGEIYDSNEYFKVAMKGYYARPIVIKCIGALGLYDIAMFGQSCTANLIRLGGTPPQVTYKYTKPPANGEMGYLYIKSNRANISHTIFSIDTYGGGLVGTLEQSTAEEYNNATAF